MSEKTEMAICRSIYTLILTFGCESWALTSKHERKLQAQEMRHLRAVAGKTRRGRVRNTHMKLDSQPLLK